MGEAKTKIVATIGPSCNSVETLTAMLEAGMNVARLNFSHGDFESHGETITKLRQAADRSKKRLALMADLSGPKIRIGEMAEPVELSIGDQVTLTTEEVVGDAKRFSVNFPSLPNTVKPDDILYLNDGLICIKVQKIDETEVHCEVRTGGELSSRKGLDLPGIDLGISAFTDRDKECLEFALKSGVDAVSQSFVSSAADIEAVRSAAADLGYSPFIIAKIERKKAMDNLESILEASDGIMVARGDLGVEIPIAEMAIAQKDIMQRANAMGKPVITATQMLESMTEHRRPTRAEATDVANAILDGTDAVMLSAESAVGRHPVAAVAMLAQIAVATEPHRPLNYDRRSTRLSSPSDLIAWSVQQAVTTLNPTAVVVPSRSGHMARNVTRFRLPVPVTVLSTIESTCQALQFSYGLKPILVEDDLEDWTPFIKERKSELEIDDGLVILTQGPSDRNPDASNRLDILNLST